MTDTPTTTVPANLLPGLVRPGVLVDMLDRPYRVLMADRAAYGSLGEIHLHSGDLRHMMQGCSFRTADIILNDPCSWDAAVAALARLFWPNMQDTDRAEFCFADGAWTLFAPARLQRAKLRPRGFQASMGWREVDPNLAPVEALRCVLLIVSGREG